MNLIVTTKIDVKKIVEKMKEGVKLAKPKASQSKTPFNPVIKVSHRERDMRQDAIDMGSHSAKELFGNEGVSNQ